MDEHPSLDLLAAAEMIGGYRWLEHRLFEITGAWSAQAHDPAVRLHLFEASHQHAWHAQLWADRLPLLDQLDPEALSVPYGPAAGPLIDALRRGRVVRRAPRLGRRGAWWRPVTGTGTG